MPHVDVLQIDHVEMFVPDRHVAAEWYREMLGLEIVEEFRFWAEIDGGPLMIGTREGGTKLALFEGMPQSSRPTVGFHRVAFRVGGEAFTAFLKRIDDLELTDRFGKKVTADTVHDHDKAFSVYFSDPWGHNLEITTYEYEIVQASLELRRDG